MELDVKDWLEEENGKSTLLGICPMSNEIIKAALLEAKEKDFVPMFIATPRQVDADRGYTGWSQEELIEFIEEKGEELDFDGQYLIARDHGGPYQSMRDRGDSDVELSQAIEFAEEMFAEDVKAGFDILHVDATEDATVDGGLELSEVADRTTEIITFIEEVKEEEDIHEAYYEVGTEEIIGGMTKPEDFESFIELLKGEITGEGGEEILEKLLFIVGQVGTRMRIDMTNQFDPEQAETLVDIASDHGLFLKVHYTDWLENSDLEKFPDLGIGAANVGPEFAASIIEALAELEEKEKEKLEEADKKDECSGFMEILEDTAVHQAPWKKFAPDDLSDEELEEFAENNRENIAFCVGRYVMNETQVLEARKRLYENIKEYSSIEDPHKAIIEKIRESIGRYVEAFDLEGTAD